MNLDVTIRAIPVLGILIVLRTSRLLRADAVRNAMARQTQLRDATRNQ